jgi:hypothetical protein
VGFGFRHDGGLSGRHRTYKIVGFIMKKRMVVLSCAAALSALVLVGCPKKASAEDAAKSAGKLLEQAGKALDGAAKDAGNALEGAAKEAGQNAKNAADDLLKNAGK